MNLKYTRLGKIAISMLMFVMLVFSSVSNSHAIMHAHDVDVSAVSDELKSHHSGSHVSHSKHHDAEDTTEHKNGASDGIHNVADMCCSSMCTPAIVMNDFASNGPRFSQHEFDWRSAPLLAGELASLHRPPNT